MSQSDWINWIVISMYLCSITASKGFGCKGRMDGWMDGLMPASGGNWVRGGMRNGNGGRRELLI